MLFCRHSIFLPAFRIVLQSGNSSAMAAWDHINIAVVIPTNAHRMIVPMFAIARDTAGQNLPALKDFFAESSEVQML
jgi:hypothetical protein